MDFYACESFIDFCDDMMIGVATEGKIKDAVKKAFKKKTVSISSAKKASSIDQVREEIEYSTPLIAIQGERWRGIVDIFKREKSNYTWSNVSAAVSASAGYSYTAYSKSKDAVNGKFGDNIGRYRLKEYNGTHYLVRNDYEIAEAQKKK